MGLSLCGTLYSGHAGGSKYIYANGNVVNTILIVTYYSDPTAFKESLIFFRLHSSVALAFCTQGSTLLYYIAFVLFVLYNVDETFLSQYESSSRKSNFVGRRLKKLLYLNGGRAKVAAGK